MLQLNYNRLTRKTSLGRAVLFSLRTKLGRFVLFKRNMNTNRGTWSKNLASSSRSCEDILATVDSNIWLIYVPSRVPHSQFFNHFTKKLVKEILSFYRRCCFSGYFLF